MRLGTLTLSASLSAILLSGCSFGGQSSNQNNTFAAHPGQYGQYGQQLSGQGFAGQRCQIASPRQPIPRGCRPEQVTIGTSAQAQGFGAYGGFPQQPQFGQPQYTSGAYGNAVGQTPAVDYHATGPRKSKPKLRGALSLGLEPSISGQLFDFGVRDDLDPASGYNPQDFIEGRNEGSQASGLTTETRFTANDSTNNIGTSEIFTPNSFESSTASNISFEDAWSVPVSIKGGLEYILNDHTTVFANAGYTFAEGNTRNVATVDATLYRQITEQAFSPQLDGAGVPISGAFVANGAPTVRTTFNPNQRIAEFSADFSNLQQYDLEIGARHYFNPIVKTDGFRTVTPFVGGSIGAARVNAVDVTFSQTQAFYERAFDGVEGDNTFDVPSDSNNTRLYDAQWLPQGQVNFGAEWQVTPGFALAAETGLKVQGRRDYSDFTNAAGEVVSNASGERNVSIPVTLRGSVNF